MIKCTVKKQNGDYVSIDVDGHAGFANRGKDIVCASVSMLVINTINAIEEFTDDSFIGEADEKRGRIKCEFPSGYSQSTRLLLDTLILGLKSASEQYSKYVTLIIEEV